MKKILFGIVVLSIVVACNTKKEKAETTDLQKDSTNVDPKVDSTKPSTQVTVNNDGPLYISKDKEYNFRVISKDEEGKPAKILLRNEISGRIYDMERVISASGEKYQDADGNYFWIKGDDFTFGKADKEIIEGKSEHATAEEKH